MSEMIETPAPTDNEFRGLRHICSDSNCHVNDFIASLEDKDPITLIRNDVAELKAQVDLLMSYVGPISQEIGPLVKQLSESPMFKMITGGK